MTYPVGNPPDGAYRFGSRYGYDLNEDSALTAMTGGIRLAYGAARQKFVDQVESPLDSKPGLTQIPIGSPMWQSIIASEESTFPRSQLTYGAAGTTSSGGNGDNSHSHRMGVTPQYKPAGNGGRSIEIGYITCTRDRTYTEAGFITGDAVTFLGIEKFHLGVYSVDVANGDLHLLNPISAAMDFKGSMGATNTEYRFNLGTVITAKQGDIFAVATLQVTGAFQTTSSLMATTLTDLNPPGVIFPRKNYGWCGPTDVMHAAIHDQHISYANSDKLPFYVLR
ncbi:hypothetical protein ACWZHB_00900 [Nocardia sp. FBN12]|uniref:hypothetical protein n=1 Tax=Nocardia sp. FBN12 TaxID=3419766 RepID=UPI003D04903A